MATVEDLDHVIEQYHLVAGEFIKGNAEPYKEIFSHREDMSLANPFGPPVRGWNEAAQTMERAASRYRDGEIVGFEIVAKHVSAELAYVVEVEQLKGRFGGREELSAYDLRVTMIFRPEDGEWKVVHRHADQITATQPAESVIQG